MFPKVSIIVLNWNGKENTRECLESLKQITYPNYEVLLVDNGSVDGSVEYFRKTYPKIKIIENVVNLGYAEGNNEGIRRAMENEIDYVLLLNNDIVTDSQFLKALVDVAQNNPKIGFVGPKIYYYSKKERRDVINFAGGKINMWFCKAYHIGINEIDRGQYNKLKYVDYVEGSCILVKKEVIDRIGILDSSYFAYWEDVDWCIRGIKAGYKLAYAPESKIWHKISGSNIGGLKVYYFTRNKYLFIKKNANNKQQFTFMGYSLLFNFWANSVLYLGYYKNWSYFSSFIKGTIDGLRELI